MTPPESHDAAPPATRESRPSVLARLATWGRANVWPSLCTVLALICLATLFMNQRLRARYAEARSAHDVSRAQTEAVREALWDERGLVYGSLGHSMRWPVTLERVGVDDTDAQAEALASPRLVVVLNEEACSACQNDELTFAQSLAQGLPLGAIRAVVVASARRYAVSVAHVNHVTFPVYFDPNNLFAGKQGITHAPAVLLLDPAGTVTLAHYPLPGQSYWGGPFRAVCRRLLNVPARER